MMPKAVWQAVGHLSEYLLKHPTTPTEDALSDCLVATQCSPSADDRAALREFRQMWEEILSGSREEVDALIQSDLELAKLEGNYEIVVFLYASDQQTWQQG